MRHLIISFLLMMILYVQRGETSEADNSFYGQMARTVVRLEYIRNDSIFSAGTGFFIQAPNDELFLVTARHVAEKFPWLQSRVLVRHNRSDSTEIVWLKIPGMGWVFHSQQSTDSTWYVDVAVCKLPSILDRTIMCMPKSRLAKRDPGPPDPVVIYGYPGLRGVLLPIQRPVARGGIVSCSGCQEYLYKGKLLDHKTLLADVWPETGMSGGPVIFKQGNIEYAIGGLQTHMLEGKHIVAFEPVSRIIEAVNHAIINPVNLDDMAKWFSIE